MAELSMEESAREVLRSGAAKAEVLLNDPTQVDEILTQAKSRIGEIPGAAASALSNVPLMITMIKCYITGEYKVVSPKTVASVLGALIYLVKGKDLIPDNIPLLGLVDDVAVIALAMKLNEPELNDFDAWQKGHVILRSEQ